MSYLGQSLSPCFFVFRIDWLQQGSRELFGTVIESLFLCLQDRLATAREP